MNFKKFFSVLIVFSILLSTLSATALAAGSGTGEAVYSNTLTISDGFTYTNEISYNSLNKRIETFAIETTSESEVFPIVMACDTIYGGMTVNKMIEYAESLGYNVLGAVNSDFFSMSTKVPLGAVIENGEYKSSPEGENILAFSESGAYVSESPEVTMELFNMGAEETESEASVSNYGKTVTVSHLNKMRADTGGLYIFTSAFSTVSTRSTSAGWAVRFKITDGTFSIGDTVTMTVEEIIESGTSYAIGDGYVVLTAADECGMRETMSNFSVGDSVTLTITASDERLNDTPWATGCGDILVSDGAVTDTANWDSALFGTNPRTAVGIKADGSIVYYVVDGRVTSYSNGAKMSEAASDLISKGCTTVVNLDGGGSSVIALRVPGTETAAVLNKPSDGSARSCASYILFVTNVPDESDEEENPSEPTENSTPKWLYLQNEGAFILQGSEIPIGYFASNSDYKPVTVPEDIKAVSSLENAIEDNIYHAENAGADKLQLSSDYYGSTGGGTLYVISEADTVSVINTATNKTPVFAGLSEGDQIQLGVTIKNLTRDVLFSPNTVTYSMEGDAGTVDENGLFTAGKPGTSGTLTVTTAGKSITFDIVYEFSFSDIADHWAKEYIESLYDAGIVNGLSDGSFGTDLPIIRGDFVLMLYRAFGEPEVEVPSSFTDVDEAMYYSNAVSWAESTGITLGNGDGTFTPSATLTREQAFTMVYRAFFANEENEIAADILDLFTDGDTVSEYARVPAAYLVELGIVSGANGNIAPQAQITRSEMAKILCTALTWGADYE